LSKNSTKFRIRRNKIEEKPCELNKSVDINENIEDPIQKDQNLTKSFQFYHENNPPIGYYKPNFQAISKYFIFCTIIIEN